MKNIKRLANERNAISKVKQFATEPLTVEETFICDSELRIKIKAHNDFYWRDDADNVKTVFSSSIDAQIRELLPEIMRNALAAVCEYENDLVKATQDEALELLVKIRQMQGEQKGGAE